MAKYLADVSLRKYNDLGSLFFEEQLNMKLTNKQIFALQKEDHIVDVKRCISFNIVKISKNSYRIEDRFDREQVESFKKLVHEETDAEIIIYGSDKFSVRLNNLLGKDLEYISDLTMEDVENYEKFFISFYILDNNIPLRSKLFIKKDDAISFKDQIIDLYGEFNLLNIELCSTLDMLSLNTAVEFDTDKIKFITKKEFEVLSDNESYIDVLLSNNIIVSDIIFNDYVKEENKNKITRVAYLPTIDKYMATYLVSESSLLYHKTSVIDLDELKDLMIDQNVNHCLCYMSKDNCDYIYLADILKELPKKEDYERNNRCRNS